MSDKKEYGTEEILRDFVSPAEYKNPTDLCDCGILTVKTAKPTTSEEYGNSYTVTFEGEDSRAYLSYVSAKNPYTVFDTFKDAIIGCKVKFEKIITKDKKTVIKMRLVESTPAFDKACKDVLKG